MVSNSLLEGKICGFMSLISTLVKKLVSVMFCRF